MSIFEALNIALFGVILPTADVGSDYWLAAELFVGREVWDEIRCGPLNFQSYEWQRWYGGGNMSSSEPPLGPKYIYNGHLYGAITLLFPSLSFLFVAYQWWRIEDPKRKGGLGRWKTLPFLLCQCWVQFRMLRLLYLGLVRKNSEWRREQRVLLENVTSIEPFIESVPQLAWTYYLSHVTKGCIGPTLQ